MKGDLTAVSSCPQPSKKLPRLCSYGKTDPVTAPPLLELDEVYQKLKQAGAYARALRG